MLRRKRGAVNCSPTLTTSTLIQLMAFFVLLHLLANAWFDKAELAKENRKMLEEINQLREQLAEREVELEDQTSEIANKEDALLKQDAKIIALEKKMNKEKDKTNLKRYTSSRSGKDSPIVQVPPVFDGPQEDENQDSQDEDNDIEEPMWETVVSPKRANPQAIPAATWPQLQQAPTPAVTFLGTEEEPLPDLQMTPEEESKRERQLELFKKAKAKQDEQAKKAAKQAEIDRQLQLKIVKAQGPKHYKMWLAQERGKAAQKKALEGLTPLGDMEGEEEEGPEEVHASRNHADTLE
ncbi:hypothetical protein CYMTET_5460 [Cymbomonas tetramitiformis]|uniref:Uncharacterized protein n=1 Tax=Cymbomonas tetramitiformis TaxID=36881 RepID=A0AAE0GZ98_9CHLO|nr:hypothetical protein CYMTET_5460 [Cymbomonas tetramitiformis]